MSHCDREDKMLAMNNSFGEIMKIIFFVIFVVYQNARQLFTTCEFIIKTLV